MRPELLRLAHELTRRGEAFAIVTVIGRDAPISAQVGDVALVTAAGAFHGWVGGSCTRPTVVAEAEKALRDGRPRRVALDPDPEEAQRPGVLVFPMTCHSGGRVEIHIQPVLPAPRLLVFGLSPVARALVRLGKAMGYAVEAVDPAAEASAFPEADSIVTSPAGLAAAAPPSAPSPSQAPVFAVVATQGQWDEEAIGVALRLRPAYLGVVASARRFADMRDTLAGDDRAAWEAIDNPAGLDIGARTAEEVALSVLAGIVSRRRAAGAEPPRATAAPATEAALDPVCGMTVSPASTPHRADYQGRTFFFCAGGCRQRFLADPERYAAVGV